MINDCTTACWNIHSFTRLSEKDNEGMLEEWYLLKKLW